MLLARDAGIRRLAGEILLVQAATTIAIAAVCALFWGRIVALSALAGGTTGLIAVRLRSDHPAGLRIAR